MSVPDTELCDRYEQLYPGAVADALDELGFERQTLPVEINPVIHGMTMAGIAYPVRGNPDKDADYTKNIRRFLRMLGDAPEHSVVAYETHDEEAAHLGELSTTALEASGCRGAVIDGGCRDLAHILDQGFPVFTRYRTPKDAPPRWRLADWDVPIQIGNVEIRPGDVLVGDIDGVVCVPQDVAEEVLVRSEETADTENEIREKVRDGADPLTVFEEYGKF